MSKKMPSMASISRLVNKTFKDGSITIGQILDKLEEKHDKEQLRAGVDTTYGAMQYSIDTDHIFAILYGKGCIAPRNLTDKQKKILKQWQRGICDEWDSGEDGRGGQYAVLESIKWGKEQKRLPRFI